MLKVVSTRCLEKCVREAQQIMGGLGYARGGKGGRYVLYSWKRWSILTILQDRGHLQGRQGHGCW